MHASRTSSPARRHQSLTALALLAIAALMVLPSLASAGTSAAVTAARSKGTPVIGGSSGHPHGPFTCFIRKHHRRCVRSGVACKSKRGVRSCVTTKAACRLDGEMQRCVTTKSTCTTRKHEKSCRTTSRKRTAVRATAATASGAIPRLAPRSAQEPGARPTRVGTLVSNTGAAAVPAATVADTGDTTGRTSAGIGGLILILALAVTFAGRRTRRS